MYLKSNNDIAFLELKNCLLLLVYYQTLYFEICYISYIFKYILNLE